MVLSPDGREFLLEQAHRIFPHLTFTDARHIIDGHKMIEFEVSDRYITLNIPITASAWTDIPADDPRRKELEVICRLLGYL